MNSLSFLRSSVLLAALLVSAAVQAADANASKLRILLVYGGHDFETNQFFQVFRDNAQITFQSAEYPKAEAWFKPARASEYDVLVFYDMWSKLSDEGKTNLAELIRRGKPLVALHHTLAASPEWDEYATIIGGKYHQKQWSQGGLEKPASTYLHDVDFRVHVADPQHPVTRGVKDFEIHDETYGGFEVKPGSHILLTTDHSTSGREIAWAKTYGAARVVYIQLGHDHQAYENSNYRRLLAQAIQWVAKRD